MHRLLVLAAVGVAALAFCGVASAWTWPADGDVLRPFTLGGDAYAAGQHRGLDVAGPEGSPIHAPAAGTVGFAGSLPTYGRGVTIVTADGYAVTLVHLGSIGVAKGDTVAEGASVGTMGRSGDPEHGVPSVHLGVRVAAQAEGYVDPLGLLPPRATPPSTPAAADAPSVADAPAAAPVSTSAPPPAPVVAPTPGPAHASAAASATPPAASVSSGPTTPVPAAPQAAPSPVTPAQTMATSAPIDGVTVTAGPASAPAEPASVASSPGASALFRVGSPPRVDAPVARTAEPPARETRRIVAISPSMPPHVVRRSDSRPVAAIPRRPSPDALPVPRKASVLPRNTHDVPGQAVVPVDERQFPRRSGGASPEVQRPVHRAVVRDGGEGAAAVRKRGSTSPTPRAAPTPVLGVPAHGAVGRGALVAGVLLVLLVAVAVGRGARRIGRDGAVLRHHADLLRQLHAAHRSRLHDRGGRRVRASSTAARP